MADLPTYSIRGHFGPGCAVLLTGASGYIGSLVLEKLLRSTDVGRVFVLLRARGGRGPAERLDRLLRGPLFHRLRAADGGGQGSGADAVGGAAAGSGPLPAAVLRRVVAVAGDILQPGLGLCAADAALLQATVDTVIHSAADIRLEPHIHETLRANYRGSVAAARLAARMPRLRSFVLVSTCYVGINRPRGSLVEERIYPLQLAGAEVDAAALAEELLSLPPAAASARAAALIDCFGFRNTYALGKHLAEKAVASVARAAGLPLAVLRPSLVSAVASEPYAGYTGNYAGQVGALAAYISGLYNDNPAAVAADGDSAWDVVPGDLVAHAIIAAAAATAARAAPHAAPAPGAGRAAAAAAAPRLQPPLVVQAATSTTHPLTTADCFNAVYRWVGAHPRPFTLAFAPGGARPMAPGARYDAAAVVRNMWWTRAKVELAAWLCRLMGRARSARLFQLAWSTFTTINARRYDLDLFFDSSNLGALAGALRGDEAGDFFLSWRAPAAASGSAALPRGCRAPAATAPPVVAPPLLHAEGGLQASGAAAAVRKGGWAAAPQLALVDATVSGRSSSELSDSPARAASLGDGNSSGGGNGSSGGGGSPDSCSTPGSARAAASAVAARALLAGCPCAASPPQQLPAQAVAAAAAGDCCYGGLPLAPAAAEQQPALRGVHPATALTWQEVQANTLAYLYLQLFGTTVPREAPLAPARLAALRRALPPGHPDAGATVRHTFERLV
ncbi:hypothetical protein Rsub_06109 [Raphidocelis subcapitata]|uniref:Fatty acyl-CoA reductase n=1 Tax=Raphidocelis subcapitata TaxID=307507 RepID=A0A2V0P9D3_9CHLO|nr:hypothetical protein Rsub_06109 [Raphidocelis subcapitata]|eukprot:GBF93777.1 hypothetical protein Rsub_06109 [Raphidocelis subcapitata]